MASECRILVAGSDVGPFQYSTRFLFDGLGATADPLESHYLYGDGDLAVFLEDLGIDIPIILLLLNRLSAEGSAETAVRVPAEVLEVLSRHARDGGSFDSEA